MTESIPHVRVYEGHTVAGSSLCYDRGCVVQGWRGSHTVTLASNLRALLDIT